MPTNIPKASFNNSVRLTDLVKDGKIYLSLSDAIALAIENNYDIAIARYDLDIADTDILRTRAGGAPLGAPSGLVTGTFGGWTSTLSTGGGPGGTAGGAGGAGSGVNGLTLTTAGAGPLRKISIRLSGARFNSNGKNHRSKTSLLRVHLRTRILTISHLARGL